MHWQMESMQVPVSGIISQNGSTLFDVYFTVCYLK